MVVIRQVCVPVTSLFSYPHAKGQRCIAAWITLMVKLCMYKGSPSHNSSVLRRKPSSVLIQHDETTTHTWRHIYLMIHKQATCSVFLFPKRLDRHLFHHICVTITYYSSLHLMYHHYQIVFMHNWYVIRGGGGGQFYVSNEAWHKKFIDGQFFGKIV